jgi:hypothetical protein
MNRDRRDKIRSLPILTKWTETNQDFQITKSWLVFSVLQPCLDFNINTITYLHEEKLLH